MRIKSTMLRRQCAIHRNKEPCRICGQHKDIAQAHHVMSLKEVAQLMSRCRQNMEEPPVVWLCPNHHAYVHKLAKAGAHAPDLTSDERKKIYALVELRNEYMDRQINNWIQNYNSGEE